MFHKSSHVSIYTKLKNKKRWSMVLQFRIVDILRKHNTKAEHFLTSLFSIPISLHVKCFKWQSVFGHRVLIYWKIKLLLVSNSSHINKFNLFRHLIVTFHLHYAHTIIKYFLCIKPRSITDDEDSSSEPFSERLFKMLTCACVVWYSIFFFFLLIIGSRLFCFHWLSSILEQRLMIKQERQNG